jgi:hypothetical protein
MYGWGYGRERVPEEPRLGINNAVVAVFEPSSYFDYTPTFVYSISLGALAGNLRLSEIDISPGG